MAAPPTIYLVCSDRDGNGKTLLARVLVDALLSGGRDPFCFDLGPQAGKLRSYFPGRTALVDFNQPDQREKALKILTERHGRDYVIDAAAEQLAEFCDAVEKIGLVTKAHAKGSALAVLYIVDRDEASLNTAVALERVLNPDLFVPVSNRFIGSALPDGVPGPVLVMDKLHHELVPIITSRRFSLRDFMHGGEDSVPARFRANLQAFLQRLMSGMSGFEDVLKFETPHTPSAGKRV